MNPKSNRSQTNLNKSLAYIVAAVVLGTALMLSPIWLFQPQIQYKPAPDQYLSPLTEATQTLRGLSEKTETLAGVKANQPTDTISVSIILTVSTLSAFGASLYLKKKTPSSTAM